MNEPKLMTNEIVDDIPLLITQIDKMGLQEIVDKNFLAHGNRSGLSIGNLVKVWLTYIISESDHCMNHVQDWATSRTNTLRACIKEPVTDLDFSDDRLADVLKQLSNDEKWSNFQSALNKRLLKVYDLEASTVRLDSTVAAGYWSVTEEGLFQFGHNKGKNHLAQVKMMFASLDPLGMPLITDVVSGECADDPLYIPAIDKIHKSITKRGLLYIGDSKMAAQDTRVFIHNGGDYYLCPLPEKQVSKITLSKYVEPVVNKQQQTINVYRKVAGKKVKIALGYELTQQHTATCDGKDITWTERRFVVKSLAKAESDTQSLLRRLATAEAVLLKLNERKQGKAVFTSLALLQQKADTILQKYAVQNFLQLNYYEVLPSFDNPDKIQKKLKPCFNLTVARKLDAITNATDLFGWRVYASNLSDANKLSLPQAILSYREQYIIERGFGRLKGKSLSLSPMYIERDDHATGLIRLLSIALYLLTLIEFVVRSRLAAKEIPIAGLYPGNPKRATTLPTTESLLRSFRNIIVSIVHFADKIIYLITDLSALQKTILNLLEFPEQIYSNLFWHYSDSKNLI